MARRASLAFASPRRIIASMRVRRDATRANSAATKNAFASTSRRTAPRRSRMEPESMSVMAGQASYNCVHRPARVLSARSLGWALGLTVAVMAVEVVGGLLARSLALLADAAHMLTDAGALAPSLFAA